jgi:hypothetical protein
VKIYNEAAARHDQGMMTYAADIMAGSGKLVFALADSKTQVAGGFDALADLVGKKSEQFANVIRMIGDTGGKAKPAAPQVNFNGGQTFNIKQDFRDQDPDRMALVFERDIIRSAENRRQARTASPFGM